MDAAAWDARYEESGFLWRPEPNVFLVDEISELSPGTALDLGSGEGRNAVWLAEHGWRVTAIDFSPIGVAKGRQLAADRGVEVEFVVADVTELGGVGQFDLIVVFYLQIDHAGLGRALATAANSLKPGGTLLIVGHDLQNLTDGVGGPQSADVLYTTELLLAHLPGLEVEKAEVVRRSVEGEEREALDTLVRVKN